MNHRGWLGKTSAQPQLAPQQPPPQRGSTTAEKITRESPMTSIGESAPVLPLPKNPNLGMLVFAGDKPSVSADKTSVVSAGKTSAVSADVLFADITHALPADTIDVLSADTTGLSSASGRKPRPSDE